MAAENQQLLDNMAAAENQQQDQHSDDESWAASHENSLDSIVDDSDWDLDSNISVDDNEQIQDADGFIRVFPTIPGFVPAREVSERAQRVQQRRSADAPVDPAAPQIPDVLPGFVDVRPSPEHDYTGKF